MFGPKGNPQAKNLFDVIAMLQQAEGVSFSCADRAYPLFAGNRHLS